MEQKLEILIANFHKGQDDPDAVEVVLKAHKFIKPYLVLNWEYFNQIISDLEPDPYEEKVNVELFCEFNATLFNYLDYLDAKSEVINKCIKDNYEKLITKAESSIETNPSLSCGLLRLALCAATIYYRSRDLEKGEHVISKINDSVEKFSLEEKPVYSYLLGQLYFIKAEMLVRLTDYKRAEKFFDRAIPAYEDWQMQKESYYTGEEDPKKKEDFRKFVSYKICITRAFLSYAYVLQGKLKQALHEVPTIERLLEQTNHDKTRDFVKLIRARALRLSGFGDRAKLFRALQILHGAKESAKHETDFSSEGVVFAHYSRHALMGLFQEGLTYFYLYSSGPDKKKDEKIPGRENVESFLDALQEVIARIRELNTKTTSPDSWTYWEARAHLLESYLFLCKEDFKKAIEAADGNIIEEMAKLPDGGKEIKYRSQVDDIVTKIETFVAGAESRFELARYNKNEGNSGHAEAQLLKKAEGYLDTCFKIKESFQDEKHGFPSVFGRVYLLRTQIHLLKNDRKKAEESWALWEKISEDIENTRWHSIADKIEEEMDNPEDRFIFKVNGDFEFKAAKDQLYEWLYKKAKSEFSTDLDRIKELKVSREFYYKKKSEFERNDKKNSKVK